MMSFIQDPIFNKIWSMYFWDFKDTLLLCFGILELEYAQ